MEIIKKDISTLQSFNKYGREYSKIWSNDEQHLYVFKVTKTYNREDGSQLVVTDYEVVKGMKVKNPDGSIVYAYPNTESFGTYGYFINGFPSCYAKERIVKRLMDFNPKVETYDLFI